jgi:hypothetical protein
VVKKLRPEDYDENKLTIALDKNIVVYEQKSPA